MSRSRTDAEPPGSRPAKPPVPQPLEIQVYMELFRAKDRLWTDFLPLFRAHGLTPQQYNALRILRGGDARGLSCQTIGERMVYRVPDVTRMVDRLEKAGFVERGRIPEDRRVVLTRITAKGREVLARLDEPVLALHRSQLSHVSKKELNELLALLHKVQGR
jgi:DNA-binding MarR family transcriptional regulator